MYLTHSVTHFALCTWQHVRAAPSATQPLETNTRAKCTTTQPCLHGVFALPALCRHSVHRAGQPWVLLTNASRSSEWGRSKIHHEVQYQLKCSQSARALQSLTTHSAGRGGHGFPPLSAVRTSQGTDSWTVSVCLQCPTEPRNAMRRAADAVWQPAAGLPTESSGGARAAYVAAPSLYAGCRLAAPPALLSACQRN